MKRSAPLRRTRLKRMSSKRRGQLVERTALLLGLKAWVKYRCEFCNRARPLEGHEVRKPRSKYWLNPEYVVMLCGGPGLCHDRCEGPYKDGRLLIPGTRSTGWGFELVYARNKAAYRASSERSEAS